MENVLRHTNAQSDARTGRRWVWRVYCVLLLVSNSIRIASPVFLIPAPFRPQTQNER